jgi:fibronectin-binding autotransporter adhesin
MINRLRAAALAVSIAFLAARAPAAGVFTFAPITGDADSGISTAKTYTHAVDFGAGGNAGGFPNIVDTSTTVNGVPFLIGGTQGPNYSTTGLNAYIGTNPWTSAVPNGDNSVGDLLNDFYWRNTPFAPADQTLTLTRLTPGTPYVTTFYNAGWEAGRLRVVTVGASDGGSVTFDQNFTGATRPNVLRYAFVAPASSITYTFSPADPQNAFHQYGFTNEVAMPEPAALGAGAVGALLLLFARRREGWTV